MAREFRLPDVGEGLVDATLVSWRVAVGDHVVADQVLAEMETDKSLVEIPSPFTGTVLHLGAAEGETVPVGATLVVVGEPGESWGAPGPGRPDTAVPASPGNADVAPIVGSLTEATEDLSPVPVHATDPSRRPRALPLVRKLAQELGVDLATVRGSGPHGRIVRNDVHAAVAARAAGPRDTGAADDDERRPLSRLRRTIAANLTRAWSEIPQATAFTEVDATRLLDLRRALVTRRQAPVPMDALLLACAVPALRAHPELNATLDGDDLVLHRRCDIGVAVDSADGLMVAVVRDVGAKSLADLCDEVTRLAEGVRARTLLPSSLAGQTFTVSNIGAVGGGYGVPIVPAGTVAILSVGRAADQPVVRDGQVAVAPMMPLSLSYDHRVVDGGLGRRFLDTLVDVLAEPALLMS